MRKYLIVAVAALAIAGCSKKDADADGDGKVSNEEAKAEMASGGAMAMKPGEWEVKISFDSVEGPGVKPEMAKMKVDQAKNAPSMKSCITKEQVEKPGGDFFGAPESANCTFDSLSRSSDTLKVKMTCKPTDKMVIVSTMDGKFAAETYTMNIEQKTEGTPMGAVTMKGKIEGRRVGDCPA